VVVQLLQLDLLLREEILSLVRRTKVVEVAVNGSLGQECEHWTDLGIRNALCAPLVTRL
jgi:hypothetical protein